VQPLVLCPQHGGLRLSMLRAAIREISDIRGKKEFEYLLKKKY
jgi:hypothetical protein